jgi:hypothetical protein
LTETNTPTITPSITATFTPTETPSITATNTPTNTPTATATPETAAPVGIAVGDTVTDSIEGNIVAREYTFNATAGDRITISMTATGGELDTLLILRDPNGNQVAIDDDGGEGLNSLIENFVLPVTGEYTILATRFQGGTSEGTFELVLTEAAAAPTDIIEYGNVVTGNISDTVFSANYRFTASAGDIITIRMNGTSGNLDPLLILRDPGGNEIARGDDGGEQVFYNAIISGFAIPTDGVYTIVATRFREVQGATTGAYELRLTLDGTGGPPITEGTAINIGDTVTGQINSGTPIVAYTFNGRAGDPVDIRLIATSGNLDPLLIVLGPDGDEVARDDDGGEGRNSLLENFTLPADGTYTILATRFRQETGTSEGGFELALTPPGSGPAPTPTGPVGEGTIIAYGDVVTGAINDSTPGVRYVFPGQSGDVVTIELSATSGNLDTLLILLGPDGNEIARNDDDGGLASGTDSAIRDLTLPANGRYSIVATRFRQEVGLSAGSFELRLISGSAPVIVTPGGGDLSYGQTATGEINNDNPQVEFTFAARDGDVVSIRLTATSGNLDPLLILLGPAGAEVARNDDGGEGRNSFIESFTIPADGLYTIIATRFRQETGTSEGSFDLQLDAAGGPPPPTGGADLVYGDVTTGEISNDAPQVQFTFNASAGDVISIALTATGGNLDPLLIVLGPDGNEVARNDDGGEGRNSFLESFTIPANGTYTIVATRFRQETGTSEGPFELTLSAG